MSADPIAYADCDPKDVPHGRLILGMPNEAYRAYGAARYVRATNLKHAVRSAAHYRSAVLAPPKETKAMRDGRMVHQAVLEPEVFAAFESAESLRKDEADSVQLARDVRAALSHNAAARRVLHEPGVLHEVSVFWHDAETQLPCKARFDALKPLAADGDGWLADLKTTLAAEPASFRRDMGNYGYSLQLAHYQQAAVACGALRGKSPVYVVAVEKSAPFGSIVYDVAMAPERAGDHVPIYSWLDNGHDWLRFAMLEVAEATARGVWTGYTDEVLPLDVPPWTPRP